MKNVLILGLLVAVGFFLGYRYSPEFRKAADDTLAAARLGPTTDALSDTTSKVFKKAGSGI